MLAHDGLYCTVAPTVSNASIAHQPLHIHKAATRQFYLFDQPMRAFSRRDQTQLQVQTTTNSKHVTTPTPMVSMQNKPNFNSRQAQISKHVTFSISQTWWSRGGSEDEAEKVADRTATQLKLAIKWRGSGVGELSAEQQVVKDVEEG